MKRFIALLVLVALTGCSTLVTIRTDPEDARIYINNDPKGKAPFMDKLPNGIFTRYVYRIEADGHKPLYGELQKEFKWGAFIAGWFFVFPWVWVAGPRPIYYFELQEEN